MALLTDDFLLFVEALEAQISVIQLVLPSFCASSGQSVNAMKSWVFYSKNVHHQDAEGLAHQLGILRTIDLDKYLGSPIIHGIITKKMYLDILEKVQKKI